MAIVLNVMLTLKDFLRLQAVMYAVKVVQTTNRIDI